MGFPGSDIYVMNSNGTGAQQLTNGGVNISPAWSPNGTTIAFDSSRDGSEDIWTMSATNGGSLSNLTGSFVVAGDDGRLSQERWPAWSPDSSKIAFYTNKDGLGAFHIYLMNSDGATSYAQTSGTFDFTPTWSPDGTQIAFASFRSGNSNDIYVMSALTPESSTNVPVNVSNVGASHSAIRPNWAVVPLACLKKFCHF